MVFVIHRINGLDGLSNVYVLLQQFGGWFGDLVASSRAVVPILTLGGEVGDRLCRGLMLGREWVGEF